MHCSALVSVCMMKLNVLLIWTRHFWYRLNWNINTHSHKNTTLPQPPVIHVSSVHIDKPFQWSKTTLRAEGIMYRAARKWYRSTKASCWGGQYFVTKYSKISTKTPCTFMEALEQTYIANFRLQCKWYQWNHNEAGEEPDRYQIQVCNCFH